MKNNAPLNLLEEFLLLALNAKAGQYHPVDSDVFDRAIASAVLLDLSLCNRIDYDLKDLFVVDPTPTGDDILDPVLNMVAVAPVLTPHRTTYWLNQLTKESPALQKRGLKRLERRGIVRPNIGLFWMFGFGSSPAIDEAKTDELKASLKREILGTNVPSTRTIALTGLVNACGFFQHILNETEAKDAALRIAEFSRMDLISQAAAKGFLDGNETPVAAASGNR